MVDWVLLIGSNWSHGWWYSTSCWQLCDSMGVRHLPFGSASYFQLDNSGPFILTICVDGISWNHPSYILWLMRLLDIVRCHIQKRTSQENCTSVPVFRWKDGEAPNKMGPVARQGPSVTCHSFIWNGIGPYPKIFSEYMTVDKYRSLVNLSVTYKHQTSFNSYTLREWKNRGLQPGLISWLLDLMKSDQWLQICVQNFESV